MENEKLSPTEIGIFIGAVLLVSFVGLFLRTIHPNPAKSSTPTRCHEWSEPDAAGMQHCLQNCGTNRYFRLHPGLFFPRPETIFKNRGDESVVGFPCRRDIEEAFNQPLPTLPPPKY